MKAVLLISHGSQSPKTKQEVESLVNILKKQSDAKIFTYAFLELQDPSIPDGIDHCISQGASEIVILLNFLNSGKHVDQDIPKIVDDAEKKYPSVKFSITRPVGQHAKISDLFLDLI